MTFKAVKFNPAPAQVKLTSNGKFTVSTVITSFIPEVLPFWVCVFDDKNDEARTTETGHRWATIEEALKDHAEMERQWGN